MSPENTIRAFFLATLIFLALMGLAMSEDTYRQYQTAEEQG